MKGVGGVQAYGSNTLDWLGQDLEPLFPRFELDWVPFGVANYVWSC